MRSRTAKSGRSYLQTQARWGALAEGGSIVVKWWAVATVLALVGTALPPAAGQVETALYAKKKRFHKHCWSRAPGCTRGKPGSAMRWPPSAPESGIGPRLAARRPTRRR